MWANNGANGESKIELKLGIGQQKMPQFNYRQYIHGKRHIEKENEKEM